MMAATADCPALPGRIPPEWERRMDVLEAFFKAQGQDAALHETAVGRSYGGPHIQVGHNGGMRRSEARHAESIHQIVDAVQAKFPLHVRTYALPALALLPVDHQMAVRLCYMQGYKYADVGRALRPANPYHPRTIANWLTESLWQLAHKLWSPSGEIQIPPELWDTTRSVGSL